MKTLIPVLLLLALGSAQAKLGGTRCEGCLATWQESSSKRRQAGAQRIQRGVNRCLSE